MTDSLRLQFGMAELNFEQRNYRQAAVILEGILEELPGNAEVRTLLARSYFHAAMLRSAEAQARALIERSPVDAYAHIILGRSLQRQSRHEEAAPFLRLAAALTGNDDLLP
jgi:predicted Zn-dependent protease